MINRCSECDEIIKEGEVVRVVVRAAYHYIKSKTVFAINRDIQDAYSETLQHYRCPVEA